MRHDVPLEAMEAAELPDAAVVMMMTRQLNGWLGTSYTLHEVAALVEREPLLFEMFSTVADALRER